MATADRIRELIEHLRKEGRTQEDIASVFGRSQGWVSQVVAGRIRDPGGEPLRRAASKLRLAPGYFEGTGPLAEYLATAVERDDARSPYEAVERYLSDEAADERPPVSEDHARELRDVRFKGEVTVAMIEGLHRGLIARDRGKATADRGETIKPVVPEGKRAVTKTRRK